MKRYKTFKVSDETSIGFDNMFDKDNKSLDSMMTQQPQREMVMFTGELGHRRFEAEFLLDYCKRLGYVTKEQAERLMKMIYSVDTENLSVAEAVLKNVTLPKETGLDVS